MACNALPMKDDSSHKLLAEPMFESICAAMEGAEKSWNPVVDFEADTADILGTSIGLDSSDMAAPGAIHALSPLVTVDRVWRHIREHVSYRSTGRNPKLWYNRVRSAQWLYWHTGEDLWEKTGEMFKELA